jgi:hypothetical protein
VHNKGWKLPITRACVLVLQESGRPLHYREITALLLKKRLILSRSAAVERCVYSGMSKHIRTSVNGSWFIHAGRGRYALTEAGRALLVWRIEPSWVENAKPNRGPQLDLTWQEAATRVLREAGKPLHVNAILTLIWRRGYKPRIDAAVPHRALGNLLAQLARQSQSGKTLNAIERVAPGTYSST